MRRHMPIKRRDFLTLSAAGAAGIALAGCSKDSPSAPATPAWQDDMPINPDISNMRVVCCHDTTMVTAFPFPSAFSGQNTSVDSARIAANIDELAKQLVNSNIHPAPTAAEAWGIIFRKPAAKTWSQVKAAIKVNCINTANMPRVAIVQKLVSVLSGLGVLPANTIIYDGCSNASGSNKYTPYCSLTDISKIPAAVSDGNDLLGGTMDVSVTGISPLVACTADIANGAVDILIDVAVSKGHGNWTGAVTLCMKNHFGTFAPVGELHATDSLFTINKHSAIIGGSPVRQQLCIIDSLVGSESGPGDAPTDRIDRIIMGTFAPCVDYCCVKQVREAICGWSHDDQVVARFMTDFGYTETDPVFVAVTPAA
jgi:hypothetical protein